MKILYINTLYEPYVGGGAEITLRTLVEGIKRRGHNVVVLTTGPEAGTKEEVIRGVRVIRAGGGNVYWHHRPDKPIKLLRAAWHMRDIYNVAMGEVVERVVRAERPDIVSCHNLAGWSASAWVALRRANVPILQVLHDLYNLCPNSNMFRNERSCVKRCARCSLFRFPHSKLSAKLDAVVGVSRYVLDRHINGGYFKESGIREVIHNVRDLKQKKRSGLCGENGRVRFGFIGTLTPSKGIELLLNAFVRLRSERSELYIAGKGSESYEKTLKEIGMNNVFFLGYVTPESFFSGIDVLIVPSLWNDTLPGVVFESLIYGVPVIGSRRGGIPEMISHGSNGLLFEPDRPDELLSILEKLSMHPAAIESLQCGVSQSALPFLDMDGWFNSYCDIYRRMLS